VWKYGLVPRPSVQEDLGMNLDIGWSSTHHVTNAHLLFKCQFLHRVKKKCKGQPMPIYYCCNAKILSAFIVGFK